MTIIKEIAKTCEVCQIYKNKNYVYFNIPKNISSKGKLDIVAMDFFGELITSGSENKYVLVMIDLFIKFVKLFACQKKMLQK